MHLGKFTLFYRATFLLLLAFPAAAYIDAYLNGGIPIAKAFFFMYAFYFMRDDEVFGGARSDFFVRKIAAPVLRLLWGRFNIKIVKSPTFPATTAKSQFIFALHPHSILPVAGTTAFVYDVDSESTVATSSKRDGNDSKTFRALFPGIEWRYCVASMCFMLPAYREVLRWCGFVDAARFSVKNAIARKYSIVLVPGGATEALHSSAQEDVLVLNARHGFIRLALEHGIAIVPVFAFNENNLFDKISVKIGSGRLTKLVARVQTSIQVLIGWSVPLVKNIFPKRANVTAVFGDPVPFDHVPHPTAAQLDAGLQRYKEALSSLYANYGPQFNEPPTKSLRFV